MLAQPEQDELEPVVIEDDEPEENPNMDINRSRFFDRQFGHDTSADPADRKSSSKSVSQSRQ